MTDFDRWYLCRRDKEGPPPAADDVVSPIPLDETDVYFYGRPMSGVTVGGPPTIKRRPHGDLSAAATTIFTGDRHYDVDSIFLSGRDAYFAFSEFFNDPTGAEGRPTASSLAHAGSLALQIL